MAVDNLKIEYRAIGEIQGYSRNARTHPPKQVEQLAASIKEFGFTNPILVSETGEVIAGHGRLEAAKLLGLGEVPTISLCGLSDQQRKALVLADNRIAESSTWNKELLSIELQDITGCGVDLGLMGFTTTDFEKLVGRNTTSRPGSDKSPEPEQTATSKTGDVWVCGAHRIMCGDSTSESDVRKLLNGRSVDLVCTDPPYCSGGFQETGKSAGSVGTSATHKMVANDTLSTRGFIALLRAAFAGINAPFIYAFTDWRMWVHLFDVAESSGYGVRSMIVWDKGTPGMGRGWRAQHELILWGCKQTAPFDKHASGTGNVISEKRTGNVNHTTEKPVSLIKQLILNVPFVKSVADPFAGSGTTLIACEEIGVPFFGIEMDPLYVDVCVKRWQAVSGKKAVRESDGVEFDYARAQADTNRSETPAG